MQSVKGWDRIIAAVKTELGLCALAILSFAAFAFPMAVTWPQGAQMVLVGAAFIGLCLLLGALIRKPRLETAEQRDRRRGIRSFLPVLALVIGAASGLATSLLGPRQPSPPILRAPYGGLIACNQARCGELEGEWRCGSSVGFPGGHLGQVTADSPSGQPTVLCAELKAQRVDLDQDYVSTCPTDPPQPASAANSLDRRCTPPCNDMSVELCRAGGGSNASIICELKNADRAPAKRVLLCGCWR